MQNQATSVDSRESRLILALRSLLRWDDPQLRGVSGRVRSSLKRYLRWNRRLLLDPWLRYQPAIVALGRSNLAMDACILDVGSGSVGLSYFLRHPVVAVDVEFSKQEMLNFRSPMSPVRASATHLPFRDSAFEAVVSMDMLEHLSRFERPSAIRELFRVSGAVLIVGFPFGQLSAEHDRNALAVEAREGIVLPWRKEHVSNGIPDQQLHDQLVDFASTCVPARSLSWSGHESLAGLRLRWKLQLLIGSESRLRGMLIAPLYWIHAKGHHARAYRRVYVIRSTRTESRC